LPAPGAWVLFSSRSPAPVGGAPPPRPPATLVPTVSFSGLTDPVSSLEGAAALIGRLFPATYFITLSRGVFSKALGFTDLQPELLALAAFGPALTLLSVALLPKQGR